MEPDQIYNSGIDLWSLWHLNIYCLHIVFHVVGLVIFNQCAVTHNWQYLISFTYDSSGVISIISSRITAQVTVIITVMSSVAKYKHRRSGGKKSETTEPSLVFFVKLLEICHASQEKGENYIFFWSFFIRHFVVYPSAVFIFDYLCF